MNNMEQPRRYCAASILHKDKYLIHAQYDPAADALMAAKIKLISGLMGLYNKRKLFNILQKAREAGMIVLLESRNEKHIKHSPLIVLSERGADSRPFRDRYYEHFQSMMEAGELGLPDEAKERIKSHIGMIPKSSDPRTGKVIYDFSQIEKQGQEGAELNALLVLIAAHVDPPKGLGYFLEVEKNLRSPSTASLSRVERMRLSLAKDDLKREKRLDARIAETQDRLKDEWRKNTDYI